MSNSKALILSPEVTKFQAASRCTLYRYPASTGQNRAPVLANFSKMADRNGTKPISKKA